MGPSAFDTSSPSAVTTVPVAVASVENAPLTARGVNVQITLWPARRTSIVLSPSVSSPMVAQAMSSYTPSSSSAWLMNTAPRST